ncbi:hypothetical protein A4X13_0g9435 [Tilletia indica]|uniref:Uncharacterized protein n=1 Tax=Tilletia indica TaxID=43049 RepID=A0A8T8S9K3_9BASI|nr:hypothetical protein A4X13_0g9435 [Tilletia indica]
MPAASVPLVSATPPRTCAFSSPSVPSVAPPPTVTRVHAMAMASAPSRLSAPPHARTTPAARLDGARPNPYQTPTVGLATAVTSEPLGTDNAKRVLQGDNARAWSIAPATRSAKTIDAAFSQETLASAAVIAPAAFATMTVFAPLCRTINPAVLTPNASPPSAVLNRGATVDSPVASPARRFRSARSTMLSALPVPQQATVAPRTASALFLTEPPQARVSYPLHPSRSVKHANGACNVFLVDAIAWITTLHQSAKASQVDNPAQKTSTVRPVPVSKQRAPPRVCARSTRKASSASLKATVRVSSAEQATCARRLQALYALTTVNAAQAYAARVSAKQ